MIKNALRCTGKAKIVGVELLYLLPDVSAFTLSVTCQPPSRCVQKKCTQPEIHQRRYLAPLLMAASVAESALKGMHPNGYQLGSEPAPLRYERSLAEKGD